VNSVINSLKKETKLKGLQKIPDILRCPSGVLHDRYMAAIKVPLA